MLSSAGKRIIILLQKHTGTEQLGCTYTTNPTDSYCSSNHKSPSDTNLPAIALYHTWVYIATWSWYTETGFLFNKIKNKTKQKCSPRAHLMHSNYITKFSFQAQMTENLK